MPGIQALTWSDVKWKWRTWWEESAETKAVFENPDGDRVKGSAANRFDPEYGNKQYAKLKDLERGVREDYGRRLHTAMLTFTASSTNAEGEPLPPVDHLDGLLESWDAVRRALDRVMGGRRYERLAILEPHKSGYLHIHVAVFVDGKVTPGTFAPVVDAHLENCELAERDAHPVDDITVRWAGGDRDHGDPAPAAETEQPAVADGGSEEQLDELAIYLAEYLGTYGEKPTEQPEHVQMANALLWATGRQRWRPSNGAQQYMATEQSDEPTEWELVGIEDREGDIHEYDGTGGVERIETYQRRGEPPPTQTRFRPELTPPGAGA